MDRTRPPCWVDHTRPPAAHARAGAVPASQDTTCLQAPVRADRSPLLGEPDMAAGSTRLHRRSTGEPGHHKPVGACPSGHYAGLQHCAGRPRHPAASPRNWEADTPDHVAAAQPWSDTLAHLPQCSGWANDEPARPALSAQQRLTPGLRQGLPCPALPWRMAPGRPQGCPSRPGSAKQNIAYNKHYMVLTRSHLSG